MVDLYGYFSPLQFAGMIYMNISSHCNLQDKIIRSLHHAATVLKSRYMGQKHKKFDRKEIFPYIVPVKRSMNKNMQNIPLRRYFYH